MCAYGGARLWLTASLSLVADAVAAEALRPGLHDEELLAQGAAGGEAVLVRHLRLLARLAQDGGAGKARVLLADGVRARGVGGGRADPAAAGDRRFCAISRRK